MLDSTTQALSNALQIKVNQLGNNPGDIALRTAILNDQVNLTSQQLGISKLQAARAVRGFTAAYATSKGLDPNAVLDSLNAEEQKILDYSKSNPTLYGLDLVTAQKLAGALGVGSGILLTGALTLFTIALFTGGAEVAAAVTAGEGVVATIGSVLGGIGSSVVGKEIAGGGFLFLLSQALGHLSTNIPMMTKQMIDNGSIGPGLRITAIKLAEDEKQKLSGAATSGPFTTAEFTNYAIGLEAAGVQVINNPNNNGPVAYSRSELSKLIQYVFGQAILNGKGTTATKLIPQITPYLKSTSGNAVKATTASAGAVATPSVAKVKVFTGVVSTGTLGAAVEFTGRENDLISSVAELQDAAQNNLASFAQTIPGKLRYEIRIVSSVKDASGFTRTGGSQQVLASYDSKGNPRYKTIVNRFAVLDVFVMSSTGSRVKLKEIVLGPTDAVKLQPNGNDLAIVSSQISSNLFTTNIADITGIQTSNPVTVSAPPVPVGTVVNFTPPVQTVSTPQGAGASVQPSQPASALPVAPAAIIPAQSAPAVALAPWQRATTLSEFYSLTGRDLPPVTERGRLYGNYGLGSSALYTGTAEQNTKLLAYMLAHYSPG